MLRKLTHGIKYLLERDAPGRSLFIYDDDVFIVSYPKSGNTWVRFLIANLLHSEDPVTFLNIEQIVPDPDLQSRRFLKHCRHPRVMKSHHPFDPRYKRVVCLVRDPRDVAVSQYHFQIKRGVLQTGHPVEDFVRDFVAGTVSPYGSWGQNVGSWLIARHKTPDFVLLRYEDLMRDAVEGLAQVASLLNIPADRSRLEKAVQFSSADRMRAMEKEQAGQWASTRETRKDIPFIRAAQSGEWKVTLSPNAAALIERAWGGLMRVLGYLSEPAPADAHQTILDLLGIASR